MPQAVTPMPQRVTPARSMPLILMTFGNLCVHNPVFCKRSGRAASLQHKGIGIHA
jgi:hypothetical protein